MANLRLMPEGGGNNAPSCDLGLSGSSLVGQGLVRMGEKRGAGRNRAPLQRGGCSAGAKGSCACRGEPYLGQKESEKGVGRGKFGVSCCRTPPGRAASVVPGGGGRYAALQAGRSRCAQAPRPRCGAGEGLRAAGAAAAPPPAPRAHGAGLGGGVCAALARRSPGRRRSMLRPWAAAGAAHLGAAAQGEQAAPAEPSMPPRPAQVSALHREEEEEKEEGDRFEKKKKIIKMGINKESGCGEGEGARSGTERSGAQRVPGSAGCPRAGGCPRRGMRSPGVRCPLPPGGPRHARGMRSAARLPRGVPDRAPPGPGRRVGVGQSWPGAGRGPARCPGPGAVRVPAGGGLLLPQPAEMHA